jgi:hypothetical protein
MLLFSSLSLRCIYSLFIDVESDTIGDLSRLDADHMRMAYNHLVRIFADLNEKLRFDTICSKNIIIILRTIKNCEFCIVFSFP